MALKPGMWFRVHQHPNIEFEMTLAGALHEVRLTKPLPVTPVTPVTTPRDDETGGRSIYLYHHASLTYQCDLPV